MSHRRKALLALVMVPMAVLLTLGSISIASAHPASDLADTHQPARKRPTIKISAFTFTVPRRVHPGATVKVVNQDAVAHTVTSDDGTSFDVAVPAKTTVRFKAPATVGKYAFHCSIHPTMMAQIIVK